MKIPNTREEYKLIESTMLPYFENRVNEMLREGWILTQITHPSGEALTHYADFKRVVALDEES